MDYDRREIGGATSAHFVAPNVEGCCAQPRRRFSNGVGHRPRPCGGKESSKEITSPRGSDLCNTMKLKGEALKQNDLFFDSE